MNFKEFINKEKKSHFRTYEEDSYFIVICNFKDENQYDKIIRLIRKHGIDWYSSEHSFYELSDVSVGIDLGSDVEPICILTCPRYRNFIPDQEHGFIEASTLLKFLEDRNEELE